MNAVIHPLPHRPTRATTVALAAALLACAAGPALADPGTYTVQLIERTRTVKVYATALSDHGVAGYVTPKNAHAFKPACVVIQQRSWTAFRSPGAGPCEVQAINDGLDTVGDAWSAPGQQPQAFLQAWGLPIALPLASYGFYRSTARGINASRTIVGTYSPTQGTDTPYAYHDGTLTPLPTLGFVTGATTSNAAVAINDAGTIAGTVQAGDDPTVSRAATWTDGTLTLLPGLRAGDTAHAVAIASNGLVAGDSAVHGGQPHAVRWSGGVATDLGDMGNPNHLSVAYGVNASGDVVGYSPNANLDGNGAFLYTQGHMVALRDRVSGLPNGYTIQQGLAITDAGVILATGWRRDGEQVFMLLLPVAAARP